jgi:hypothetical protein
MATAALPITKSLKEAAPVTHEVRIWGMDTKGKPFIQTVTAGQFTERTAVLTGVLPITVGDVIGVRFRDDKSRYSVSWVSDEDTQQVRSIGVDCLEDKNFFNVRKPGLNLQVVNTSALYAGANGKLPRAGAPGLPQMPNRRQAERVNCRVAADISMANGTAQAYAWVSDISVKGCYLQMITPFAVGSEIGISVYAVNLAKESPLSLRAVVRTSHPMVGMGIEFVEVSGEADRLIQVVVEQLGGKSATEKDSAAWMPAPTQAPTAPPVSTPQAMFIAPTFAIEPPAAQPAPFSITPQQTQKPDLRGIALRICMDIQKLESETVTTAYDVRLRDELRQAAVHMRSAWHLYGVDAK